MIRKYGLNDAAKPHAYERRITADLNVVISQKTGVVQVAVVEVCETDAEGEVVEGPAEEAAGVQVEGVPHTQVDQLGAEVVSKGREAGLELSETHQGAGALIYRQAPAGAAGVRDPLSLVTSALAVVVELEQNLLVGVEAGEPGVCDGVVAGGEGREDPGGEVHPTVTTGPVGIVVVGAEAVEGDGGAGGGPEGGVGTRHDEWLVLGGLRLHLINFKLMGFKLFGHLCHPLLHFRLLLLDHIHLLHQLAHLLLHIHV